MCLRSLCATTENAVQVNTKGYCLVFLCTCRVIVAQSFNG